MKTKLIMLFFCAAVILFGWNNDAFAKEITVKIDGEVQDYSQPPRIINDKLLVPVRGIFDSLGARVTWNNTEKKVTAEKGDTRVWLKIGEKTAGINDENIELIQEPVILESRTMIPVRFVSEAFGAKVMWNGQEKTVLIQKPKEKVRKIEEEIEILSSTSLTASQAQKWAKARGATQTFIDLAPLYWEMARECGGVNPAGAYAQAAKETGFGRYGGVVVENFKNPCGMKTTEGGPNSVLNAHMNFDTWEDGVKAHLDHLALYAGADGYPLKESPDPRHFEILAGTAETFNELGEKWAPSSDYGESLVEDYIWTLLYG